MYFTAAIAALVGSAALCAADSVTFKTLDDKTRTIYFTGSAAVDPVTVSNAEDKVVTLPDAFVGNFYSVIEGEQNTPGMLGEINFAGWGDIVFFDVSAIVNSNDKNNVKEMWPASSGQPISGCENFPCNNAYYLPDDVQTKSTTERDLVTTLGGSS